MPVKKKVQLKENNSSLKVDLQILKDSINLNRLDWQMTKLVEDASLLINDVILYSKEKRSSRELAQSVGKTFIGLNIIAELIGSTLVQSQIDLEQQSIKNKVSKLTKREDNYSRVGFRSTNN